MKETAIDKLVGKILTEADKYNEDGDVIGIELWNAYKSCIDLSEFVEQANELFKEQIIKAYNESFLLRDKPYATAEKYYNETYENTEKEQFYQTTFTMKESNLSLEELRKTYDKLVNSGEIIVIYVDKDGNLTQLRR